MDPILLLPQGPDPSRLTDPARARIVILLLSRTIHRARAPCSGMRIYLSTAAAGPRRTPGMYRPRETGMAHNITDADAGIEREAWLAKLRPAMNDQPASTTADERDALPIHNDRRYFRALLPLSAGVVDETRAWQELLDDATRLSVGSESPELVASLQRDYEALWEAGATLADLDLAKPWRAQVDAIVRGEWSRGSLGWGSVPQKQGATEDEDGASTDGGFSASDAAIADGYDQWGLFLRDSLGEAPLPPQMRASILELEAESDKDKGSDDTRVLELPVEDNPAPLPRSSSLPWVMRLDEEGEPSPGGSGTALGVPSPGPPRGARFLRLASAPPRRSHLSHTAQVSRTGFLPLERPLQGKSTSGEFHKVPYPFLLRPAHPHQKLAYSVLQESSAKCPIPGWTNPRLGSLRGT